MMSNKKSIGGCYSIGGQRGVVYSLNTEHGGTNSVTHIYPKKSLGGGSGERGSRVVLATDGYTDLIVGDDGSAGTTCGVA